MLEDALEIATDPDYKFDLAVQLGRLEVAKVLLLSIFFSFKFNRWV
jgi:coatomer subunit beta'